MSRKRSAPVAPLLALAVPAFANASMGLALEDFDYRYWFVYVAVTVIFEAWYIGQGLRVGWLESFVRSLSANAVTGLCCSSCFAPFLHSTFVGSAVNPNPFLNVVLILSLGAILSSCVEQFFWPRQSSSPPDSQARVTTRPISKRSLKVFAAHFWGVPLALLILLIPERPYVGLEALTSPQRKFMSYKVNGKLAEWVNSNNRIPTKDEFMQILRNTSQDAWTIFYAPNFHRFDLREERRDPLPVSWNTKAFGEKVTPAMKKKMIDRDLEPIVLAQIGTGDPPGGYSIVYNGRDDYPFLVP